MSTSMKAKRIADWVFNVLLCFIAGTNFTLAVFYGDTVAKLWTFVTVGIAFAVTAFFFIRYSILEAREESK